MILNEDLLYKTDNLYYFKDNLSWKMYIAISTSSKYNFLRISNYIVKSIFK